MDRFEAALRVDTAKTLKRQVQAAQQVQQVQAVKAALISSTEVLRRKG